MYVKKNKKLDEVKNDNKKKNLIFVSILFIIFIFRCFILIDNIKSPHISNDIYIYINSNREIKFNEIVLYRSSINNNLWKINRESLNNIWTVKRRYCNKIYIVIPDDFINESFQIIGKIGKKRFSYNYSTIQNWKKLQKIDNLITADNNISIYIFPKSFSSKKTILPSTKLKSIINWPGDINIIKNEIKFYIYLLFIIFIISIFILILFYLAFLIINKYKLSDIIFQKTYSIKDEQVKKE